jgi:sigma-E factor negative regulatory protein RseA
MTRPVDDSEERRWLQLSALCDGEAALGEAQDSFERWRDDPRLRERWHSYQWIGDVMRSEDFASAAEHDQAFVLALRERLAREPVVLAPVRQPAAAPMGVQRLAMVAGGRRMRWSAPAAMAAGVMAVAGALVVIRSTGPVEPVASSSLAQAQPEAIRVVAPVQATPASDTAIGPMLRDADLDRYFEAHRQFARGPALSAPSAVQQVVVKAEGR